MDKMFVKDQDCVSHTLEIIDKNPWYNGQSLFQGHNREFFDALNYSTSIKSECFFKNQGIFFNLFLRQVALLPAICIPLLHRVPPGVYSVLFVSRETHQPADYQPAVLQQF